ncbi:Glucose/arabinose dehydrogenase, beta-propeller fold [Aquiflexum balticum DSM 16537]|uniref:Glucose/arabinose dehydrogenase, beta-propeller fold n=1 Tax=Aquiflexum balticum DSM 16537 TaxID=758820 RepID=A0A1W2H4J5_9BACT|nr:PQQ-dependent sugar dehydrogenase [Aquiflexum balticum]SMD43843.1 Glucose/arabinose dehydrogenase, beta-propeller fold [Aquiflexum balticum DSM 16537]
MKSKLLIFLVFLLYISCGEKSSEKESYYPVIGYIQLDDSVLEISEMVTDLEVPWDLEAVREGELWFTQVSGSLHRLDIKSGEKKDIFQIPDLIAKKSYGLLGMTVHPKEPLIFLHYTFAVPKQGQEEEIRSRLVRYDFKGDTLINPKILLDSLPGATYHNGSRIVIAKDNTLLFSLGDIGKVNLTQDKDFLGGKILRINLDGSIPRDNPFPNNPVWAMGLRNTQGLVFGKQDQLYGSDHGPANDDEVNLLVKGGNYGWPDVQGFVDNEKETAHAGKVDVIEPLAAWTPTLAAAGLAYFGNKNIPEWENSLLLATMKGRSLRVLHLNNEGTKIVEKDIFLQKHFGRIRDISVSPSGDIFLSTSNRDWHPRFQPWLYDGLPEGPDRILRIRKMSKNVMIDPSKQIFKKELEPIELLDENWSYEVPKEFDAGAQLYTQHCLTCHGPDAEGSQDLIPPLSQTDWVTGDKGRLIRIMLLGLSGEIEVNGATYNQEMPAYNHLSDQEIADLLTFIRNEFGNKSGAVIAGEVYEERKGLKR